jgi:hypothetical protein
MLTYSKNSIDNRNIILICYLQKSLLETHQETLHSVCRCVPKLNDEENSNVSSSTFYNIECDIPQRVGSYFQFFSVIKFYR